MSKKILSQICKGFKYTFSTLITILAIIICCYGISNRFATLEGHPVLHFFLLIFSLILLAYLEGLQVAILALENNDGESFKTSHKRAFYLQTILSKNQNVQKFLVGRQFFVVFVVFLVAQVTTYPRLPKLFLPNWAFSILIETGLPGVLIVLSFGQLMPQLIASTHPIYFLNMRGCGFVVFLALALEWIGITQFSWLLTIICKKFFCCIKGESDNKLTVSEQDELENGIELISSENEINLQIPALMEEIFEEQLGISETPTRLNNLLFSENNFDKNDMKGFGITPKADKYPMPNELAQRFIQLNQTVPRFLLPPKHKDHVPPHVAACYLLKVFAEKDRKFNRKDNL